jgi:hypothetical protein
MLSFSQENGAILLGPPVLTALRRWSGCFPSASSTARRAVRIRAFAGRWLDSTHRSACHVIGAPFSLVETGNSAGAWGA